MGLFDLEILTFSFQSKVDFLAGSGHLKTQKYVCLELDDHADYKNTFCFQMETKLRNLAKICKFCKFRSTILNTS